MLRLHGFSSETLHRHDCPQTEADSVGPPPEHETMEE